MASPKHNHHRAAAAAAASATAPSSKHRRPLKQRPLVLRRAMLHSCLCFLLGLLAGLAPSGWTDAASRAAADANTHVFRALHAGVRAINNHTAALLTTTTTMVIGRQHQQQQHQHQQQQQHLVLVVTTTTTALSSSERERRSAGLTRTAHALRLLSPPVVWLVVEAAREAPPTARLLRRTGVPYRHLTYSDNFTASEEQELELERHHQRNLALAHIQQHRLRGVVLFAGLADVYDLRLLEQLRRISCSTVGAWPVATVWEQEGRVAVEGPICSTSHGGDGGSGGAASAWFSAPTFTVTTTYSSSSHGQGGRGEFTTRPRPPLTSDNSVHGFAFASDQLWDPARWDRFPTSEPDQSQDSIKFVQRLVEEDYNKTRVIPDNSNCSQIMAWRVDTTLI